MYIKPAPRTESETIDYNSLYTTAHMDHISSLYGPGAVGCWLLTALSCFLSWTVPKRDHASSTPARRRSRDSLDNDFIATLAMPAIAAGHVIAQIKRYDGDPGGKAFLAIDDGARLLPYMTEVEAATYVVEVGIVTVIFLLGLAIVDLRWKRMGASFAVAVLCEVAVWRVLGRLADWEDSVGIQTYGRWLFSPTDDTLEFWICMFYLLLAAVPFYAMIWLDIGDMNTTRGFRGLRTMISWVLIALWAILMHMMLRLSPFFPVSEEMPPRHKRRRAFFRQFIRHVPRTNHSIRDLDQAVALFAGCSVLAFKLYEMGLYRQLRDMVMKQFRNLHELVTNNSRPPTSSMELGSLRRNQ